MTRAKTGPARGNKLLAWTALVLAAVGVARIVHAQDAAPARPPAPPASAARPLPPIGVPGSAFGGPAPLGYSVPVRIDVPRVSIHAALISVGQAPDHSIGVPPLDQAQEAAWYKMGPAPGQAGSAIIDAHVDSLEVAGYRGAFYTLGQARPGQTIDVTRADHLIATFTIDSVEQTPKTQFPTAKVYAAVPYAALRLITCGGQFDYTKHSYLDNTIVYAHLTSVRRA